MTTTSNAATATTNNIEWGYVMPADSSHPTIDVDLECLIFPDEKKPKQLTAKELNAQNLCKK